MTLGEISRRIESYNRTQKAQQREQAAFDYILADLIGRSVARTQSSANKLPALYEAYPSLFDNEEYQEQKRAKVMELSALRFKHFAQSFNQNYREVANKE